MHKRHVRDKQPSKPRNESDVELTTILSLFVSSYDDDLVTNALGSTRLKGSLQSIPLYSFPYR